MTTVSSIASSATAPATAFIPAAPQAGADTRAVSGQAAPAAASPEPQISPQAKALAEFFKAASAFIQKEHFEPFTGWKRDSAGYTLNQESGYLNIEKYNNYLFDKAATTLVEQAGQLGLALDKDETLAQLKADNADIAAIRFNDADRVKYLKTNQEVCFSNLSYNEVDSLTDMYITAKENGLDAKQVGGVAFWLGIYNNDQKSGIIILEAYDIPGMFPSTAEEIAAHDAERFARFQDKIDMAGELKARLPNVTFGFDDESGFFGQLLNPRITLGGVNDDTLDFLLQMADLYSSGPASGESWTWSPSTGWTTDPDSPQAAAAKASYEGWLAKTEAELEEYFGDKAGKTGKAASSPDKTEVSDELRAMLANIAQEKALLAQLLRPLNPPAGADDDKRTPFARLDTDGAIRRPGLDRLRPGR
ncbi:MAG: hypothetical protein LBS49_09710 [Candidatus Accumulibacter sp.]|jgi:hypothetical protein|nr:hypothetical protein [Accumulibacter sp.]